MVSAIVISLRIFLLLISFCNLTHSFFFFSSRRRHTRYWRDWSSDVCSSDLPWSFLLNRKTSRSTDSKCMAGHRLTVEVIGPGGDVRTYLAAFIHNRQTLHPQDSINGCPRADGKVLSYRFARL